MDGAIVQVAADQIVYRASGLGSCTRALVAARQGYEAGGVPEKLQKVYDAGNQVEPIALAGYTGVVSQQKQVELHISQKIMVVGHLDGMRVHAEILEVLEVKSQSALEWAKPSIRDSSFWHHYKWQFSVYILASGCRLRCVRWNRETNEIKEEVFNVPPLTMSDVRSRVIQVELAAHVDAKDLTCDRDDFGCPYFAQLHERKEALEEVSVDSKEVAFLAREMKKAGVNRGNWDKKYQEARRKLLSLVAPQTLTTETSSGIKVKVTVSDVKEKHVAATTMTRVDVTLPRKTKGEDAKDAGD